MFKMYYKDKENPAMNLTTLLIFIHTTQLLSSCPVACKLFQLSVSCYCARALSPYSLQGFVASANLCLMSCIPLFRWAHVGCAVAVPEVIFVDVNLRETINTNQVSSARKKLVSRI